LGWARFWPLPELIDAPTTMPVPPEYERAAANFYEFLVDARDLSGLTTTHQTYTMAQGVLQVFRRRLSLQDAIRFANILPVGLRALFVADWDPEEPIRPFTDRAEMTHEAQSLRAAHNFAPDTAIRDISLALKHHVDATLMDRLLATFPEGARAFWET
jgi:uncharacterized protein (DUF2267 family)